MYSEVWLGFTRHDQVRCHYCDGLVVIIPSSIWLISGDLHSVLLRSRDLCSLIKGVSIETHTMRSVWDNIWNEEPTMAVVDLIPVIREFPLVFPKNLLGKSPVQAVEFMIELLPGTSPIFTLPYWMAPTELDELDQLIQELLRLGFILTRLSPWT